MDFLGRLVLYCVWMQAFCSPVFSAEWEAEVLPKIDALTRSCVVVPCTFRYPGGQKPSSRLSGLWHLHQKEENLNTKQYIYAAEVSKVIDRFKGRTRLLGKLGDDNCTLEIDEVKDHDNGPFCFRIEIPGQDNFSFREGCVSIKSFDTPEKPKLTYKEKSYEGRPYTITCSVTHTCPSHMPVLTWSYPSDSEIITHYNNHKPGIWEVQSILSFIPHARDDDSDITCQAKFHGGKSSESKMNLRVKYPTGKVDILHIIIPVLVVTVMAVIFGGLYFIMRKKYLRRIEALQNQGSFGTSMWNRISRLSHRSASVNEYMACIYVMPSAKGTAQMQQDARNTCWEQDQGCKQATMVRWKRQYWEGLKYKTNQGLTRRQLEVRKHKGRNERSGE